MSKASPKVEQDDLSKSYGESARNPRAVPGRFGEAAFARRRFYYHAVAGSELEDYLKPAFWVSVSRTIKALDLVEVVGEDGNFRAELIVRSVGNTSVDVVLLSYVKFGLASAPGTKAPTGDLRIVFSGSYSKWTVRDAADRVLIDNLPNEHAATRWAESHAEMLAQSNRGAA